MPVRDVAGDCWTSPDVAAACGDNGWLWLGVAWCRWPLALGLALWIPLPTRVASLS